MAGIGIQLRALLQQETFTAWLKAYSIGGVVSLGPFLSAVICIAGLSIVSVGVVDAETRQIFAGAVVYVFAGTLIITGGLQLVLTRYLADQVYKGQYTTLVRSLVPACLLTAVMVSGASALFLQTVDVSLLAILLMHTLCVLVGVLWMVTTYASSTQEYVWITVAFVLGAAVSLGGGLFLMRTHDLEGLIAGYAAGHLCTLLILMRKLLADFGFPRQWDWGFLSYLKLYPALVGIGVLQAVGVWVDKLLFWHSDLSLDAAGLVTAPKYDSATYLGFLTVMPAMVHFFVRIEADFSTYFHEYYDAVFFRHDFQRIERAADALRRAVKASLADILKVQGVLTFLTAFFAFEILNAVELPVSQIGMFRYAVVASSFLVFALFCIVLLLYMDQQRAALWVVLVLSGVNSGLTYLSLHAGYQYYGLGFAVACLLALLVALYQLAAHLHNLEYVTFAGTPLAGQRSARRRYYVRRGRGLGKEHALPRGESS